VVARIQAKLRRNGNAVCVTIPRGFLAQLKMLCGEGVVIELYEDELRIHRERPEDLTPAPLLTGQLITNRAGALK
jgi:antitoxin component of MazEF toxin-antitoxin module